MVQTAGSFPSKRRPNIKSEYFCGRTMSRQEGGVMSTVLPETQVTQMTTARNDAGRAGTRPPARAASLTGRPTCLIYRID